MHPPSTDGPARRDLLAIALASFAVLFFQIAATRVLSVVLWYHWAFLSISLAMLGLGAPGVWFALRTPKPRTLPGVLLLGGVALPLSVAGVINIASVVKLFVDLDDHNQFGTWTVILSMVCLLIPMLLLGSAVCLLLLQAKGRSVGRMYGADLVGASAAAALILPVLHLLPTPMAIGLLGLLPVAAALLVGARWISAGIAALLILAMTLHGGAFTIRKTKGIVDESFLAPAHVRWTPSARLSFFDTKLLFPNGHAWGLGSKAKPVAVEQYWMEQDGSAGTPITRWDGDTTRMDRFAYLYDDVTTAGYQLRGPNRVAIVGGGGGRDILTALLAGATDIDVAELNSGVIDTVSTHFKEFAGDVYHAKGVHAHASEGRSFLSRSAGNYDLIQISLIDSWAATVAGAFALAENNLYTVEAYRLYFEKLAPDGIISTSRWRGLTFRLEAGRLILLNQQALREMNVPEPERHLMVVAAADISTVLTSRRPFTEQEVERMRSVCDERGFELVYPAAPQPDKECDPPTLLRDGPGSLEARGILMTPPVDDKPFFFQSLPILGRFDLEFAKECGINSQAVVALQGLMIVLTLVTLLLFFAPFAVRRWLPKREGLWRGSGYFAAIGLSFMFIEIPWLQRFVLYLGHPSMAATVVIGALLLGAGIGALRSERLGHGLARRLWPVVPVVLATINVGMTPLFETTLGTAEPLRIAIAVALLLPVGFLLGHFFPLGMARFGDDNKAWFWAVNGAFGVLAGVCSLALAMAIGFRAVAWIGVLGYVAAGLFFLGTRRPA